MEEEKICKETEILYMREKECKEKAIRKILFEYYYDDIQKNPEKYLLSVNKTRDKSVKEYVQSRGCRRYIGAMYTINPKEDISVELFLKKMKKIVRYTCFKDGEFCLEWREMDKGLHCHMIVEYKEGQDPYACTQRLRRGCKNIVGNNLHVHVRYSNKIENFRDYIRGMKGEKKKKCFKATMYMRSKHKIDNIYN